MQFLVVDQDSPNRLRSRKKRDNPGLLTGEERVVKRGARTPNSKNTRLRSRGHKQNCAPETEEEVQGPDCFLTKITLRYRPAQTVEKVSVH